MNCDKLCNILLLNYIIMTSNRIIFVKTLFLMFFYLLFNIRYLYTIIQIDVGTHDLYCVISLV